MSKILRSLLLLFWLHPVITLANEEYEVCRVAGYYEATGDRMLHELAARIIAKNRLSVDANCSAAIKIGHEVGAKFAKPGKVKNEQDSKVLDEARSFSNLIYDAILSRVKFD